MSWEKDLASGLQKRGPCAQKSGPFGGHSQCPIGTDGRTGGPVPGAQHHPHELGGLELGAWWEAKLAGGKMART